MSGNAAVKIRIIECLMRSGPLMLCSESCGDKVRTKRRAVLMDEEFLGTLTAGLSAFYGNDFATPQRLDFIRNEYLRAVRILCRHRGRPDRIDRNAADILSNAGLHEEALETARDIAADERYFADACLIAGDCFRNEPEKAAALYAAAYAGFPECEREDVGVAAVSLLMDYCDKRIAKKVAEDMIEGFDRAPRELIDLARSPEMNRYCECMSDYGLYELVRAGETLIAGWKPPVAGEAVVSDRSVDRIRLPARKVPFIPANPAGNLGRPFRSSLTGERLIPVFVDDEKTGFGAVFVKEELISALAPIPTGAPVRLIGRIEAETKRFICDDVRIRAGRLWDRAPAETKVKVIGISGGSVKAETKKKTILLPLSRILEAGICPKPGDRLAVRSALSLDRHIESGKVVLDARRVGG